MVSRWCQDGFKMVSRLFQDCFEMVSRGVIVSRWFQDGFQIVSRWFQDCFKIVSIFFQDCLRWFQDGFKCSIYPVDMDFHPLLWNHKELVLRAISQVRCGWQGGTPNIRKGIG